MTISIYTRALPNPKIQKTASCRVQLRGLKVFNSKSVHVLFCARVSPCMSEIIPLPSRKISSCSSLMLSGLPLSLQPSGVTRDLRRPHPRMFHRTELTAAVSHLNHCSCCRGAEAISYHHQRQSRTRKGVYKILSNI